LHLTVATRKTCFVYRTLLEVGYPKAFHTFAFCGAHPTSYPMGIFPWG